MAPTKRKAKRKPRPTNKGHSAQPASRAGRGGRLGLLVLLLVTVSFATGALFLRFRLEDFRGRFEAALEKQTGASLHLGSITVNGLRGLRADDCRIEITTRHGPSMRVSAPVAYAFLDMQELLRGRVVIRELVVDDAEFVIERPTDAPWYDPEGFSLEDELKLPDSAEFRISGDRGSLLVRNVVRGTNATIANMHFDIARLRRARDAHAYVEGLVDGNAEKSIQVNLRFASLDDFEIRAQNHSLTAEDVNVFLPADRQFVTAGKASPTLWIDGRPNGQVMMSMDSRIEGLTLRDQPDFMAPATGDLVLSAAYDWKKRVLAITSAKAETPDLAGALEGTIYFGPDYPEFDLRLVASRLPLVDLFDYAFDTNLNEYGETNISLSEPQELVLGLAGTSDAPRFAAVAKAGSGLVKFRPSNSDYPTVDLNLGEVEALWNSQTDSISARLSIVNGDAVDGFSGLAFSGIAAGIEVEGDTLRLSTPLNAQIRGQRAVASGEYNFDTRVGSFTVDGSIGTLEDTKLATLFDKTTLGGAATVSAEITLSGDTAVVRGNLDATQSSIGFDWWFSKAPGVGAKTSFEAMCEPGKSIEVALTGVDLASTALSATLSAVPDKGRKSGWRLTHVTAESPHIDPTGLGMCIKVPYRITGGPGTAGRFEWIASEAESGQSSQTLSARFGELVLDPEVADETSRVVCRDIDLAATFEDGVKRSRHLTIGARELSLPPFGSNWILPLRPDDAPADGSWMYDVAVQNLDAAPWIATDFSAAAFVTPHSSGFERFEGDVEGGTISGRYESVKQENTYTFEGKWDNVPARYLLQHLHYPDVLSGRMTGAAKYSVDRDNPGTLQGEGSFDINNGQFSADFLYSLLEGKMENELASLPPSLRFQRFHADVRMDGDRVETPNLDLTAEGIKLQGAGYFIREGDMDYNIRVAVAPQTAQQMPMFLQYFNVQGHRLAQQDIELAFQVDGPTFNPRGQLAGMPPASVTLVSGALEVTTEAIKIIDLPRRILLDLLKTGGGIVGVSRER